LVLVVQEFGIGVEMYECQLAGGATSRL
jgi:hypothetical protein